MNQVPARKKSKVWLYVLLTIGGVILFAVVSVAALIWGTVSWVRNSPERAPNFQRAVLTAPEHKQLAKLLASLGAAVESGGRFDETFSPRILDGLFGAIVSERGASAQPGPAAPQCATALEDGLLNVSCSAEVEPQPGQDVTRRFVNVEAVFNLEVASGRISKLRVRHFRLGGREAPFLVRKFFEFLDQGIAAKMQQEEAYAEPGQRFALQADENAKPVPISLDAIEVFRAEHDQIHLIVDGSKLSPVGLD